LSEPKLIPIGESCPAKNGKTSESLRNKSEPKPTSPYKLKFSLLKYTNRYFPCKAKYEVTKAGFFETLITGHP
jgi:hypothetical protein